MRRWDGRAVLAVCLGLSLGMSGYAIYRTVVPASPPPPAEGLVQTASVQAVPTEVPFYRIGTTMYDEPPVGPKLMAARSEQTPTPGYFTTSTSGTLVTSLPPDLAIVAVDAANVRGGPSIASSVTEQVTYGTELRIIDQRADWFKVKLPDQREGWVAAGWVVTATR